MNSPEISQRQIDHFETQRILSDAELIKGGAAMESGRLVLRAEQIEGLKELGPKKSDLIETTGDEGNIASAETSGIGELISDVIEATRGTVYGQASMLSQIATKASQHAQTNGRNPMRLLGTSGFHNIGDQPRKSVRIDKERATVFNEKDGESDYMQFRRIRNPIRETKTVSVPVTVRKLVGTKRIMEDQPREEVVGYEDVSHKTLVGTHGSDEPAVEVEFALNTLDRLDTHGRKSVFELGFVLPLGLAKKLSTGLKSDSSIVEPLLKGILADYGFDPEELWENKVRLN